jgi:putative transcriptional regulator
VASSDQEDPNFARSVVLLVAYDADEGAMGVIVNQPTPIKLAKILPELEGVEDRTDRLWRGGPVLPTSLLTLVRSKKPVADSEPVFDDVRMLTSKAAFARTLESNIPRERVRAFAGHAGWGRGQLESEIANGDWVVMPATAEVVFSVTPEEVWPKLVQRAEGEWTFLPGGPLRCRRPRLPLGGDGGGRLLGARVQLGMAVERARAGVPTQHRIVVPRRPDGHRLREQVERLGEPVGGQRVAARPAVMREMRPRATLADDAAVVEPLVLVAQAREQRAGACDARAHAVAPELIRDGEQQRDERRLVVAVGAEDILADALGEIALVEQPIALGLGERAGDRFRGQRLQVVHGRASLLSVRTRAAAGAPDRRTGRPRVPSTG